ncbi:MAG: tyrosine-type recombinase/integrase [Melioribacteraceae bacterium]
MYLVKNNKSPFYQLVYFVNGKRTTASTKTKNEKEAIRFLGSFKKPNLEQKPVIEPITLSKFQDEYLDYVRITKSKHYVRSVKTSFKILLQFSGDVYLNRLDLRTLDKFITSTFQRTQRGASLYYRTLKAAFSKAVLWNYLSENPFKKIKIPKVSKAFPVFISESELKTILEKTNEEYLKDLFITAFYTGMRLGELLNMKWSWIDLNQNQITVKCTEEFTTKSKKERIIPINLNLKTILIIRFPKVFSINNDDYVFSKCSGIKLNENFISKQFKQAVRKSYLNEKIHFHSLRHSFASVLAQKGISLYIIKELLGHEDLATTQIYSHLQQENLRNAVNLL